MNQGKFGYQYKIGKIYVSITSPQNAIQQIEEAVEQGLNTHVSVSDFRMVCYASSHTEYNEIMQTSYLNLPDGMPLIWMARLWGVKEAQHVLGPELFVNMLKKPENGIKHFLLGDTDEVLAKIKAEYTEKYGSLIVGTFSPPFIDVNDYDYQNIAEMINTSGANLVWVSMTGQKHGYFAVRIEPFLDRKVLIGVGAAFRYSIGLYQIPNRFLQKIGLTGIIMRKHSWWKFRWYVKHSFILMGYSLQIIGRRIIGRKYYE